jgi:hypothetical protein
MRVFGKRIYPLLVAVVLLTTSIGLAFQGAHPAYAAQITSRSLTLQQGTTDGGSKPGGVVKHLFAFTLPGGGNVGSIKFQYCTTASGTCTMPSGLDTTSAALGAETGVTGFTINNSTNGTPYLTRSSASIGSNVAVTYRLDTITNPSAANASFFVRISTYSSTDTTGSSSDTGTVTASTATQIVLTGTMPESIIFCTGGTVSTTAGIPDCSTATSGGVAFNQLFSPTDTATATSQMAASTNGTTGYVITVAGPTLTNGSFTIPAMGTSTTGVRGTGQFGLNLMANTTTTSTPAVGTDATPVANGSNYKGQATTGYSTADSFKFTSGDTVANSANGGAGPTDAQIFTASYIVNVSGSQAAGTYTTTLTKIAFLVTTLGLAALVAGATYAQSEPGTGQAIEIAPPVINLKADPGQTITTKINLRGVSSETLIVSNEINDFSAAGEDGTPKIIFDEGEEDPYSLKSWIDPLPKVTLEPRQIKDISVTIHVPQNAAPGGYYGVVRFTGAPPDLEGTGVSLSASLGSLIFVRVNGDAKESLNVEEFSAASTDGKSGSLFESVPIQFIERLNNKGNTHLQPAGQITIKDMFGQKVATVNINLPPRNVLPQSIRKFEQPFDSATIGDKILFGRYTADLNISYGDSHQTLTASTSFWVIPYKLIGIGIVLIVGGFFLLRFMIKRYNRRIIRRSQGRGLRL